MSWAKSRKNGSGRACYTEHTSRYSTQLGLTWCTHYTVSQKKNNTLHFCLYLCQMLTDFQNIYTTSWFIINHYTCFRLLPFLDLSISQASVAMHLRCGGIFINDLSANLLLNLSVKFLKIWLACGQVIDKSMVSCSFSLRVYVLFYAFSALTLLVGWQEWHLACKNWVVGCLHGYVSAAKCRFAYGPADATTTHYLLLQ